MAVIKGGLVGPTGAELQAQALGQAQQGITSGVQIGENKRQFNVQQKMAALDKLASQTAGGYMTLIKGEGGEKFIDEMFSSLGVSGQTRDQFKETFVNAPPVPQAIYERYLSVYMRELNSGAGEAAAQEAANKIKQEFSAQAQKTPSQTTEDAPQETQVANEVSLPSLVDPGMKGTEGVQPVRNQLIRSIASKINENPKLKAVRDLAALEFNPELKSQMQSIIDTTIQGYLQSEDLSPEDRKAVDELRNSVNVSQAFSWAKGFNLPGINQPADTDVRPEDTAKSPISTLASQLDTANIPIRKEGESTEAFGNRIGDYVNSIIPRSAEFGRGDEGVTLPDGTKLTPQQATVVRQQIIWNLENGKDPGYIPTPKERANLPFWKEGYVYGKTPATNMYSKNVPEKKQQTLDSEYSQAVSKAQAEVESTGVTSPQTVRNVQSKVNKILKFRDFDLAEENTPEGQAARAEIMNKYNQLMNDPQAMESMAVAMPGAADVLMSRADRIRQEKQLADPNSALNNQLALQNKKLELEFAKLNLDMQKAYADFVQKSVDLGINLTGMDENTFKSAVLWSVRGEPMLSNEDRNLLETAKTSMDALIEKEGPNVVNRADFKAWLDMMNGLMNKATGTEGLNFISEKTYGLFGIDWFSKDPQPLDVVPAGQATDTTPIEETEEVDPDVEALEQLYF